MLTYEEIEFELDAARLEIQALKAKVEKAVFVESVMANHCIQQRVESRAVYDRLKKAYFNTAREVEKTLARALGYGTIGERTATDTGIFCIGDHVPESLAAEAATVLEDLRKENDSLKAQNEQLEAECDSQADSRAEAILKKLDKTADFEDLKQENASLRRVIDSLNRWVHRLQDKAK